jgi:NADH-quinone oxidoreductase subunit L
LSFVLVIGATTALFMGLVGVVKNDIKRVIAYSTLSQLGYMTVGLGASAYSVAIFHLMTHAFFKALLFLAAGAVIIAMHHEQDMRKMGGLRRRMPVTYWTAMVASLALIGTPLFSGFYSKTALIDAVRQSHRAGAGYAYFCVVAGVLVTAYYTFRMMFMTFHGPERLDHHAQEHFHDVGWNMKGPLVALAIPSLLVGFFTIGPLLFGNFFGGAIVVLPSHDMLRAARAEFQGPAEWTLREFIDLPLLLAASGVLAAWFFVLKRPDLAGRARQRLPWLFMLLVRKYYFDWFSKNVVVRFTRMLGDGLWHGGDQTVIDGAMVNGTVSVISRLSVLSRLLQSGFLYTSAFWMIIGLVVLLGWFLIRI